MKLYYSPGACSLSPHIALREAGIPFTLEKVDLGKHALAGGGGDYYGVNPKGYVPALELDDGQVLTEGPAIVQYIADQRPQSGLAPAAGTMERYRLAEWLNFITSEIHKSFSPLFNEAAAPAWKDAARANIAKRLDVIERQLDGRQYLLGERFTVADGYLFTVLNWSGWAKFDLSKWPRVQSYLARIAERPKVREALAAEGLLQKSAA
jgi:glutathione S-transferase